MKRISLTLFLVLLVVFWGVSSSAQPIPGIYDSRVPNQFLAGGWSETLVGGSEGAVGNIIHAEAAENYIFGNVSGPALSEVILIGTPGANPFYEYSTVYKGGTLTLYNNSEVGWYNAVSGQPPSYHIDLTNALVITKKYVDTGGAPTGEIEFALFVLDAGIQGYPGYKVTLNAKFDKGIPTVTPGSDPITYGGPLTWAIISITGPTSIEVPVDIKPGSCPNPINLKTQGVLPVAILGTSTFDVTQIDPVSIKLNGIAPTRWSIEDVGTPFEPYIGKENASDCNEYGGDGLMDLSLKFDTKALAAALGSVADGTILVLELTGKLKDGTLIRGEDVVTILNKGRGRGWTW